MRTALVDELWIALDVSLHIERVFLESKLTVNNNILILKLFHLKTIKKAGENCRWYELHVTTPVFRKILLICSYRSFFLYNMKNVVLSSVLLCCVIVNYFQKLVFDYVWVVDQH